MFSSLTLLSILPGRVLDTAICVGDTEEGWGVCGIGRVIDGCVLSDGVACTFAEGEGAGEGTTAAVLGDKNN